MTPPTVAALDCGTNSTRLLVVAPDGRALAREMRITRLGQGVDATGKLAGDAIDRTLAVLGDYRRRMDALAVTGARLVATSAVRDAVNGEEFLDAASEVVGVEAELLGGEEEGRLSYLGARLALDPGPGVDLVVDIGGGSTELVTADDAGIHAVSLPLGCVRLTERLLLHDPPRPDEVAAALATVAGELARARGSEPALGRLGPGTRLVGLAGTVSTLAMLELGLAVYDRDRVHGARLSRSAVCGWAERLAAEPAAARARRPGMVPGRQDVIAGGALVLAEVMRTFDLDPCVVSESDILDGLAATLRPAGT